jgi:hypothetical protein
LWVLLLVDRFLDGPLYGLNTSSELGVVLCPVAKV